MGPAGMTGAPLGLVSAEETEELLARLVAIESHEDAPGQEAETAAFIADRLKEEGIGSDILTTPEGRLNVVARLPGSGGGPSLLLNGHMDTVPPYGMTEPFTASKRDGRIYGRGAVDMKGTLAAMMTALIAFRRSGLPLAGDLLFAATAGEESYSPGASHLASGGFLADYAIVGEPTRLKTGVAHKGVAWYEAEFPGLSAHGSVPEQGINAIYRASRWISYLQDHYLPELARRSHPLLGSPTLNVGMIEGGTRPVIVPSACRVAFERRLIPGETAESALAELELTLAGTAKLYPGFEGSVTLTDNFHGVPHGPLQASPGSELVRGLLAAYREEFPEEPEEACVPVGLQFWTDGALLQACCPETVVCGPGRIEEAHSDTEYIEAEQLEKACRIYIRTAYALCL